MLHFRCDIWFALLVFAVVALKLYAERSCQVVRAQSVQARVSVMKVVVISFLQLPVILIRKNAFFLGGVLFLWACGPLGPFWLGLYLGLYFWGL